MTTKSAPSSAPAAATADVANRDSIGGRAGSSAAQRPGSRTLLVLEPLYDTLNLGPILLDQPRCVLGSDPDCDVQMAIPGIRGQHCVIVTGPRRVIIKAIDLHTWLNDGPVREGVLRAGDRLAVGPLEFRVRLANADELLATVPDVNSAADSRNVKESRRQQAGSEQLTRLRVDMQADLERLEAAITQQRCELEALHKTPAPAAGKPAPIESRPGSSPLTRERALLLELRQDLQQATVELVARDHAQVLREEQWRGLAAAAVAENAAAERQARHQHALLQELALEIQSTHREVLKTQRELETGREQIRNSQREHQEECAALAEKAAKLATDTQRLQQDREALTRSEIELESLKLFLQERNAQLALQTQLQAGREADLSGARDELAIQTQQLHSDREAVEQDRRQLLTTAAARQIEAAQAECRHVEREGQIALRETKLQATAEALAHREVELETAQTEAGRRAAQLQEREADCRQREHALQLETTELERARAESTRMLAEVTQARRALVAEQEQFAQTSSAVRRDLEQAKLRAAEECQQLEHRAAEISAQTAELGVLERRHGERESELSRSERRIRIEQGDLTAARNELSELREQLQRDRNDFNIEQEGLRALDAVKAGENQAEAARLAKVHTSLNTQRELLVAEIASLNQRTEELERRHADLECRAQQLDSGKAEFVSAGVEIAYLRSRLTADQETLDAERRQLVADRSAFAAETSEIELRQSGQSRMLASAQHELELARTELAIEREQLEAERDRVARVGAKQTEEAAEIDRRTSELTEQHDRLSVRESEIAASQDEIKASRAQLTIDREQLEAEHAELALAAANHERQSTAAEQRITTLEEQCRSLEAREAELAATRQALDEARTQLTTDREQLEAECVEFALATASHEELMTEAEERRAELSDQLRNADARDSEITAMRRELEEARTQLIVDREQLQAERVEFALAANNHEQQTAAAEHRGKMVEEQRQNLEAREFEIAATRRELEEARTQLLVDREQLQAERVEFALAANNHEQQTAAAEHRGKMVEEQRQSLEARESAIATTRRELEEARTQLLVDREQLQAERVEFALAAASHKQQTTVAEQRGAALEDLSRSLNAREFEIAAARRELDEARVQLTIDREQLQAERTQFALDLDNQQNELDGDRGFADQDAVRQQFDELRTKAESDRALLETERDKLALAHSDLEAERAAIGRQFDELTAQQQELRAAKARFASTQESQQDEVEQAACRLADRENALAAREQELRQRDAESTALATVQSQRHAETSMLLEIRTAELERTLAEVNARQESLEIQLRSSERELAERERVLAERLMAAEFCADSEGQSQFASAFEEREIEISATEAELRRQSDAIAEQESRLRDREAALHEERQHLEQQEAGLRQREESLQTQTAALKFEMSALTTLKEQPLQASPGSSFAAHNEFLGSVDLPFDPNAIAPEHSSQGGMAFANNALDADIEEMEFSQLSPDEASLDSFENSPFNHFRPQADEGRNQPFDAGFGWNPTAVAQKEPVEADFPVAERPVELGNAFPEESRPQADGLGVTPHFVEGLDAPEVAGESDEPIVVEEAWSTASALPERVGQQSPDSLAEAEFSPRPSFSRAEQWKHGANEPSVEAASQPAPSVIERGTAKSATDEGSVSIDDEKALRLRAELARMFDLPDLGSRLRPQIPEEVDPQEEPADEEHAGDDPVNTADEAVQDEAVEVPFEDRLRVELDNVTPETRPEVAPPPALVEAEDQNSISAYMERLLARTRRSDSSRAAAPVAEKVAVEAAKPLAEPSRAVEEQPEPPPTPRVRHNTEEIRAQQSSLRKVANLSARTAVASYKWKRLKFTLVLRLVLTVAAMALCIGLLSPAGDTIKNRYLFSAMAGLTGTFMGVWLLRSANDLRGQRQKKKASTKALQDEAEGGSYSEAGSRSDGGSRTDASHASKEQSGNALSSDSAASIVP